MSKKKSFLKKYFSFFFFVCLVFSFAYYTYYRKNQSEEYDIESKKALQFPQFQQITEVHIKTLREKISLMKEEKVWFLTSPLEDYAEAGHIEKYLNRISNEPIDFISDKADIDWSKYYLDEAPELSVKSESGKVSKLFVSKKSSFDGNYFIRYQDKLFLGSNFFEGEINRKSSKDYRLKKILYNFSGHPYKLFLKKMEKNPFIFLEELFLVI